MFVCQSRGGFNLNYYLIPTYKIRLIIGLQSAAFKLNGQGRLADEGNATIAKLDLQAFVINGFKKAASHLVVDLKTSSENLIAFFGQD